MLLCRRHHRAVHEEGYQVERQPDGRLTPAACGGTPRSRGCRPCPAGWPS
jgi:hypothetical protein